jgi:anti-sigma regulatory factor (Ser/Thr protein kinase)
VEDLSLHILDIAENSVNAGAKNIGIFILEDKSRDRLTMEITDDGKGMNSDIAGKVIDPFYTSRTTRRVGLGLPFLSEAAKAANGSVEVTSAKGKGTTVRATFQLSHIDRKPLGDIAATIVMLVASNPNANFRYRHEHDGQAFNFNTEEIRTKYPGLDLNTPEALSFIRDYITEHTAGF